jgi:DnaJ-class molecular chaperone
MSLTKQLKEKLSLAVANIKIPTRFPDMVYTVDLSLDDCYYGCRKSVTVKTTNLCHCKNEKKECNFSRVDVQEGIEYNVCDTFEEYKLDINPGTENNSKLVFKQKGCQSYTNKIFSGDLIIKLNVTDENNEISIKGCNIYLKIEIDISTSIKFPLLEIEFNSIVLPFTKSLKSDLNV